MYIKFEKIEPYITLKMIFKHIEKSEMVHYITQSIINYVGFINTGMSMISNRINLQNNI